MSAGPKQPAAACLGGQPDCSTSYHSFQYCFQDLVGNVHPRWRCCEVFSSGYISDPHSCVGFLIQLDSAATSSAVSPSWEWACASTSRWGSSGVTSAYRNGCRNTLQSTHGAWRPMLRCACLASAGRSLQKAFVAWSTISAFTLCQLNDIDTFTPQTSAQVLAAVRHAAMCSPLSSWQHLQQAAG